MSAEKPLEGKVAVITGAARGIGRQIAIDLARAGADILGNSVDPKKERRVNEVIAEVEGLGRKITWVYEDITTLEGRSVLVGKAMDMGIQISGDPRVDYVFLNAAGGLETDKPDGWANTVNVDSQIALVNEFRKYMRRGGGFVNIESLWSHRFGEVRQLPFYRPVARSKHVGAARLRAMIPELAEEGFNMWFLCGNLIKGTGAQTLFERASKQTIEKLREQYGTQTGAADFPNVEDMGRAAVKTLISGVPSGNTEYVGDMILEPIPTQQKDPYTLNQGMVRQLLSMYGRGRSYNKLYVDRFDSPAEDELGEGKEKGTGFYTVHRADTLGHFTGSLAGLSLFRGVDQIEMVGQVAGLILMGLESGSGMVPVLTDLERGEIHWKRMVEPGERVRIEAKILNMNPAKTRIAGEVYSQKGKLISSVSGLTFALAPGVDYIKELKEKQNR